MKIRKYPSCVHALPIFVSFDKTQIVWINGIAKWLNCKSEIIFYQTLLPFLCGKTNIYSQVFILVQYMKAKLKDPDRDNVDVSIIDKKQK